MIQLCAFADEASPLILGQIDAMKRNGISLLEIRGVDGINVSDLTPLQAMDLKKKLDASGISVSAGASVVSCISSSVEMISPVQLSILPILETLACKLQ